MATSSNVCIRKYFTHKTDPKLLFLTTLPLLHIKYQHSEFD